MITLRTANPADEPLLLALTPRLAAFPLPAWRDRAQIALADHSILKAAVRDSPGDTLVLVAEESPGRVAGFVFAATHTDYFTARPHAHVEVLAVAPASEGRGLGRLLMSGVEDWARRRGLDHITLNVFDSNTRARALYERLGYEAELVKYRKTLSEAP